MNNDNNKKDDWYHPMKVQMYPCETPIPDSKIIDGY
jgi:hypothetical protein